LQKEFWLPILQDPSFSEWVKARYTIGSVDMIAKEINEEDIDKAYSEV